MKDKAKSFLQIILNVWCIIALLGLFTGCSASTVNTVEASIDATALTVLTSQKIVLKHPCTATVTTLCADKELIEAMKVARLLLTEGLRTYWASVDAYKLAVKNGADTTSAEAAKETAYAALKRIAEGSVKLLSEPEVLAILSISNSTEK